MPSNEEVSKKGWLLIALIHWFMLAPHYFQKQFHQQHLNHWVFASFRVLSLPEQILPLYFFWGKTNCSPSHNHKQFYYFEKLSGFWKQQNSNSWIDKTKTIIYKVPFTVHLMVGLMHNSTTPKTHKNGSVYVFKKERQS